MSLQMYGKHTPAFKWAYSVAMRKLWADFARRFLHSSVVSSTSPVPGSTEKQIMFLTVDEFLRHVSSRWLREYVGSLANPELESILSRFKDVLVYDPLTAPSVEHLLESSENLHYNSYIDSVNDKELTEPLGDILNGFLQTCSNQTFELLLVRYLEGSLSEVQVSTTVENGVRTLIETLSQNINASLPVSDQFEEFLETLAVMCRVWENSTVLTNRVKKLRELGNNLMSNLCLPQAVQMYTSAIDCAISGENTAQKTQLITNRAIAYLGLNCNREAIKDLARALDLDISFVPAWTQMGYCQLYMGKGMLALRCYLMALEYYSGSRLPTYVNPANVQLVESYRQKNQAERLPQFVQKLAQCIALAERRAQQQGEDRQTLSVVVSKARQILTNLRRAAPPEDAQYFQYTAVVDPGMRNFMSRANSQAPNIFTPEVEQSVFGANGMEAVAITTTAPTSIPIPTPANRVAEVQNNLRGTDDNGATNGENTPAANGERPAFNIDPALILSGFQNVIYGATMAAGAAAAGQPGGGATGGSGPTRPTTTSTTTTGTTEPRSGVPPGAAAAAAAAAAAQAAAATQAQSQNPGSGNGTANEPNGDPAHVIGNVVRDALRDLMRAVPQNIPQSLRGENGSINLGPITFSNTETSGNSNREPNSNTNDEGGSNERDADMTDALTEDLD